MPTSSVSACHLCHLHGHYNHDNLVRTSPLRSSRAKTRSPSKASSHRHHHHHHHAHVGGYSSPLEDRGRRVSRSNSASALARLTDNSHSLPGSRSNSLSRYHREVSVLPDGGDTYTRIPRSNASTRSLDLNPQITSLLEATRTPTLPRVSTPLHPQPTIHAQPDILVNAMPRSRTNSRAGSVSRSSLPRTTAGLSQDNSQEYYLDMHRQRVKEETKKHRFNLQTVMLIGCYTLLVMIAIIVGVVLCYQNGWLGLGPPNEKSRDINNNNLNANQRGSQDVNNRHLPPDKSDELPTRFNNNDNNSVNRNFNFNPALTNNPRLGSSNVNSQVPRNNENNFNDPRDQSSSNLNNNNFNKNVGPFSSSESVNTNRNIPDVRPSAPPGVPGDRRNTPGSPFGGHRSQNGQEVFVNRASNPRTRQDIPGSFVGNLPSERNPNQPLTPTANNNNLNLAKNIPRNNRPQVFSAGIFTGVNSNQDSDATFKPNRNQPVVVNSPTQSGNQHGPRIPQLPSSRQNVNGNIPFFQAGVPSNRNLPSNAQNIAANHNQGSNLQIPNSSVQPSRHFPRDGKFNPNAPGTNLNIPSNVRFAHDGSIIPNSNSPVFNGAQGRIPINRVGFNGNSNIPTTFISGIPLNGNSNLNNNGFQIVPNTERNTDADKISDNSASGSGNFSVRKGNLGSNTIAKTLFEQANVNAQANVPNVQRPQFNVNIPREGKNIKTVNSPNSNNNGNNNADDARNPLTSLTNEKGSGGDTSSLTTQELLDLLAIRRMRDLLNSEGNAKNILNLLRNSEVTTESLFNTPRGSTILPFNFETTTRANITTVRTDRPTNNAQRNSEHDNIQKLQRLLALMKNPSSDGTSSTTTQNPSPRPDENINFSRNFGNAGTTPGRSSNSDNDNSFNTLVNKTIDGAIIRLIKNKVNDMQVKNQSTTVDSALNFNISGVSVFPLNSEDLRILLESNPLNIKENIGTLSDENIKSLEILHRLIQLNKKQPVQSNPLPPTPKNVNIFPPLIGSTREHNPSNADTHFKIPIPQARIDVKESSNIAEALSKEIFKETPPNIRRFPTDSIPKRLTKTPSTIRPITRRPPTSTATNRFRANPTVSEMDRFNSSFALMVKTDNLPNTPSFPRPTFPPPFQTRKVNRSANARVGPIPANERIANRPGRRRSRKSRGRGNKAVVRAWTHMDSTGTLSQGEVHSDGSFAFSNCRPVEICDSKKVKRKVEEGAKDTTNNEQT